MSALNTQVNVKSVSHVNEIRQGKSKWESLDNSNITGEASGILSFETILVEKNAVKAIPNDPPAFEVIADENQCITHIGETPDLSGSKLLIVDDNELNQHVLKAFLAESHAKIDVVNNGQEALDILAIESYDLVFMDVQMPVMDGLTAADKIRKVLKLNVPIIAMTAHTMQEDIDRSLTSGMNIHLTKPINPELMFKTITKLLSGQEQHIKKKEKVNNEREASVKLTKESDLPVNDSGISVSDVRHFTSCLSNLTVDGRLSSQVNALIRYTQLEVPQAIKLLQNKADLYMELVKEFYLKKIDLVNELNSLYQQNELRGIYLIAHTTKANAQYIGAYTLAQTCTDLEDAINSQSDVKNILTDLTRMLTELLTELAPILNAIKEQSNKVVIKEFNTLDAKLLIKEIKLLLESADVTSEDVSHQIFNLAKGTRHQKEVTLLHHLICDYEFDEALNKLNLFEAKL